MLNIEFKITKKEIMKSENKNAPKGFFYNGNLKFTCWDQEFFDAFNEEDLVIVEYSEIQNGQYTNRNIGGMMLASSPNKNLDEAVLTAEDAEKVSECKSLLDECPDPASYYIVMNGKKYKLVPI